jgi:hypothetical protein
VVVDCSTGACNAGPPIVEHRGLPWGHLWWHKHRAAAIAIATRSRFVSIVQD